MRVLFMGNNYVGYKVAEWLKAQGVDVVGAVLHPEPKRKYGNEILDVLDLPADRIFDGSQLRRDDVLQAVAGLKADLALSIFFGYILKAPFIQLFPDGVINLHPSYLPYNRGSNPNVWSIIEGTPAGVTLHYINTGIDTGDIIAQQQVAVDVTDTGKSLYQRLERACVELFQRTWPAIQNNTLQPTEQNPDGGSLHQLADVGEMDEIDLDATYTARDLINLLRARTFPPFNGAYFYENGRKIYLRLELYEEES